MTNSTRLIKNDSNFMEKRIVEGVVAKAGNSKAQSVGFGDYQTSLRLLKLGYIWSKS